MPIATKSTLDKSLRDAVIIKIPRALCTATGAGDIPTCLSKAALTAIEGSIKQWVDEEHLVPGIENLYYQPGSDVLWVREVVDSSSNWLREFFCFQWSSPQQLFKTQFIAVDTKAVEPAGCCSLNKGDGTKTAKCPQPLGTMDDRWTKSTII